MAGNAKQIRLQNRRGLAANLMIPEKLKAVRMSRIVSVIALAVAMSISQLAPAQGIEKWFFAYVDLLRDPVRDGDDTSFTKKELIELFKVLKENKYTVVVLSSFQFGDKAILDPTDMRPDAVTIRDNLMEIKREAETHGIEIIPEVMSVGSSEKILQTAYHLAEATPVRRQRLRLVETDGERILGIPSGDNLLRNYTFSGTRGQLRESWIIDDSFAQAVNQRELDKDLNVNALELDLNMATGIEVGQDGIFFNPWHQYRLSFTLKTSAVSPADSDGAVNFYATVRGLDEGRYVRMAHVDFKVSATQPETKYEMLVNSFHCKEGDFWFGFPKGSAGKAYISNVRLEEALGPNMIRRQDLDSTADEKEVLQIALYNETTGDKLDEGIDFDEWRDTAVEQGGFNHNRRDINIRFRPNQVKLEDQISVSYYHATLPNASYGKVCCSLRHPEVFEIFRQQAESINAIVKPKRWHIDHDEIRAMGHDLLAKGEPPGAILAENLRKCIDLLRSIDADTGIVLYNDMYDPNHNAVDKTHKQSFFPMVSGDFTDSWVGMDPTVTILNWQTAEKRMDPDAIKSWKESLKHFRVLKTPQVISGFYDVLPEAGNASEYVTQRAEAMFSAAKEDGIEVKPVAVCYYTTKRNSAFLKEFAEAADKHWAP